MDLFNLSAKLSLDDSGFRNGLKRAEGLGKGLASSISAKTIAMGQMLGNFATKAVSTVSSSLKELVKGSIDAYADYEQLVGGVETLFGTGGKSLEEYMETTKDVTKRNVGEYTRLTHAQELVMENANKAYKTAGLSVNEYMETTTSFAAALVSSLNGDTYSAAVVADMAVQDMADNANKMGSSMESIQNAYQGFAKQNYTMLDNLKLGYGGTKKEMERLLKDAGKIAGKKFNLNNLADVYEAIHVIQTELGITGTTAKEAEGTISGSISTMKAAWKNLLVAFGDPNANLSEKVDAFTKSVGTVVKNVFPVFKRVVQNMWDSLGDFGNSLGELVFGANEAGEVNWPTWDDVKDGAVRAWNYIKEQALNLGGLVFGKKEDGSVNWPTWESVEAKAGEAWELIKSGAQTLGGLVFGKKEDGQVAWPEWSTVWDGLDAFWGAVQEGALSIADTMGGLVFGRSSDGSVQWPDVEQVLSDFNTWWGDTAKPAIEDAATWVLKAFGVPEEGAEELGAIISGWWDPLKDGFSDLLDWVLKAPTMDANTAGQELHDAVETFWLGVKGNLESLLNWVLGIPDMEDADGTSMKEKVKNWWDAQVVPKLKEVLDFTLGLFKLPPASSMVEAIQAWWALVKQAVGNLVLNISTSLGIGQKEGGGTHTSESGTSHGGGGKHFAKGMWSVPYDNFAANLHRGEMVLTASQARRYRDGEGSNFDMEALVSSIVSAIQTGMQGVTVNSYLSGRSITDDVNRQTVRQLKARRFAT